MSSRIIPIPENEHAASGIRCYLYMVRHGQANDERRDEYSIDQMRVLGYPLSQCGQR